MTWRRHLSKWTPLLAALGIGSLAGHTAFATTVAISRMNDGVVCNGWAINSDIIATTAHCVLTPGHYSVSIGEKTYQAWRIWLHPEFSPESLYRIISKEKEEFGYDVALLQIVQKDLSVEVHDHLQDKGLLPGASLFAARAKRPDRANYKEIEELPYANLEYKKNGIAISNNDKGYNICYGDLGAPLFAKIGDARLVVGVIVETTLLKKFPEEFCGNEIRIIDAAVILQLLQSIRPFNK
jgi:hypothetical protein